MKAIIFDFDGVIADTQEKHAKIESAILERYGIIISPGEITKRFAGVRTEDFLRQLLETKEIKFDIKKIMEEKWERIFDECNKDLKTIPGVEAFIKKADERRIKMAVASASSKEFVQKILLKLNLSEYFEDIVSAYEVEKGKPDPDVFLLAARNLGVEPEYCLVIEDGIHGMNAAKTAGMKCIGLTGNKKASADLIVNNFFELDFDKLINL